MDNNVVLEMEVETRGDESILHILNVSHEQCGEIRCRASITAKPVPRSNSPVVKIITPEDLPLKSYKVTCISELVVLPAPELEPPESVNDDDWTDVHRNYREEVPACVVEGPEDCAALQSGTVTLRALYYGKPEPNIRWMKSGTELYEDDRISIKAERGESCIQIKNITADDSGKYVFSVENVNGADCRYASVSVEGPPDPPSGIPSCTAGPSSIYVTWSSSPFDGGCQVTGFKLEMCTINDDDLIITPWTTVTEHCHSLAYAVKDLTQDCRYIFRVSARNLHGYSDPSIESNPVRLDDIDVAAIEPYVPTNRQVTIETNNDFRNRFDVNEELGKGRFAVVYRVTDKKTGLNMAAKFIRCIKAKDREKVNEEIAVMNLLRHPKVLQLEAAFDGPKDMIMVTEYITGGELFERVVADDFTLTERDCIIFMRQICEAVKYMHEMRVAHLDLKPENIMCHTRTSHEIKIIDFGLAQILSDQPIRVLFGTPEFIPPEIINYEPIGLQSDMWSVGVICYVLLTGLSPFMGDNDVETFANITRADYDFEDEAFDNISDCAKDFISNLLVHRKEDRLTATQCLGSAWLSQKSDSMSCVKLSTDKLKKFIIRRKWQKTGNAIRALGRMATLSASRRNSAGSVSNSPRPSISGNINKMESLNEEDANFKSNKILIEIMTPQEECNEEDSSLADANYSDTEDSNDSNQHVSITTNNNHDFNKLTVVDSCNMNFNGNLNKLCTQRSDSGFSENSNLYDSQKSSKDLKIITKLEILTEIKDLGSPGSHELLTHKLQKLKLEQDFDYNSILDNKQISNESINTKEDIFERKSRQMIEEGEQKMKPGGHRGRSGYNRFHKH